MFGLWTIAKHTFKQCLRMKVAGLFIVLLAVSLGTLPFIMKGDGTLTGQIRTFLLYGTSITAALLSVMTIFLATAMVSTDIQTKQIFSIATKPVGRWAYILGRWAGVVLLDAVLLAVAGSVIYFMSQYLRTGEAINPDDRRAVETEVFAARRRIWPEPLKIEEAVQKRVGELKARRQYEDALEAFTFGGQVSKDLAESALIQQLYKDQAEALQSVAPQKTMVWKFSGIHVVGRETRATGRVMGVNRLKRVVTIESEPRLIGKLNYSRPVRINGSDGRVVKLKPKSFSVRFGAEQMSRGKITLLTSGDLVQIVADPVIQIRYKPTPSSAPTDNILASYWMVSNPTTGVWDFEARKDLAEIPATLTFSSRVVDQSGHVVVRYTNMPRRDGFATSVSILQGDIAILYDLGGFDANFCRGIGLIFIQLAFLAAMGILAGSFVSFPVGCLICFSVLPFQLSRDYLIDAVNPRYAGGGVFGLFSNFIVRSMNKILPDFSRTLPGNSLVEGMDISWVFLGETFFWTLCVQSALLLVLAWVIFRKRELAQVQV